MRSITLVASILALGSCATAETLDDTGGDGAATGGTTSSGGTTGSGGTTSSGGTTGSGGTTSSGGTTGSGGATGTGGTAATGGTTGTGGVTGIGGATGTGGTIGTGGGTGSGGTTGTGGASGTSGATGMDGGAGCNGLTASLVTSNGGGNCTEIDSASEVTSLFSNPVDTHNISSGWSFDTQQPADQSPAGPTFGFVPPFTSTAIGWRMRYQGYLGLPAAGQYCFKVDVGSPGGTSPPDACGAIYLPATANAFVVNGRRQGEVSSGSAYQTRCMNLPAGPQSIQFVYQYSANSPGDRHMLQVSYCFGGASTCANYAPITVDVLTPFATNLACR